jgi:hypothetical protein
MTRSGAKCQDWASQSPHRHSNTPLKKPAGGLDSNFSEIQMEKDRYGATPRVDTRDGNTVIQRRTQPTSCSRRARVDADFQMVAAELLIATMVDTKRVKLVAELNAKLTTDVLHSTTGGVDTREHAGSGLVKTTVPTTRTARLTASSESKSLKPKKAVRLTLAQEASS